MAFNEITRSDAAAILSEQKIDSIIDVSEEQSLALSIFENVRMSKKVLRQPLLATLPDASFVGENSSGANTPAGGQKPTTDLSWTDKTMTAEEIAVIVPIHENVLEDADIDIFATVRPKVAEAFALKLDNAIFYGTEAPATWTDANIVGKAIAASNAVTRTTSSKLDEDFNKVLGALEEDGFDVTDVLATNVLKAQLRGLKDGNGQPVYLGNFRDDRRTDSIYGYPLRYLHKRITATGANYPQAIALDASQFKIGIREDFQVKLLTEATVGGVNLAERDMVALRFKFRVAFGAFASPLVHAGSDYPAAVLRAATVA